MVARYIPQLMAIGAVLAAYRIFTQVDFISAFAPQELRESYDYIVGKSSFICPLCQESYNSLNRAWGRH